MENVAPKDLKVSYAKVTPKGILFLGIRFSCIRAVREQWFEKAMKEKGWRIKIYYYEDNASNIFILNTEEACLRETLHCVIWPGYSPSQPAFPILSCGSPEMNSSCGPSALSPRGTWSHSTLPAVMRK